MAQPILIIDAFTAEPFRGNPAAVCVLDAPRPDAWMVAVAREMNLSETAFLRRRDDGWDLRWFTPAVEVDLCGHATLASAHALWSEGYADPAGDGLQFHTRSGVLRARRDGETVILDFPAAPASPVDDGDVPPQLLPALGVAGGDAVLQVARNRWDWLVELRNAAGVRRLRPDMAQLAALECRGVVVTAPADDGEHDFISRWFGPQSGVPEDPVTGSAHCALGPWWAERLGGSELRGYQASPRGGTVGVRVLDGRVELTGRAVTVLRGELTV